MPWPNMAVRVISSGSGTWILDWNFLRRVGSRAQGAVLEAKRRVVGGEASISRRRVDLRGPLGMASREERKRMVGVVARARSKTVLMILGV